MSKISVVTYLLVGACAIPAMASQDPTPSCAVNPNTSVGTLNFDGSCTYDHPQVLAGGQMIPVAQGDGYCAIGFCAVQGKTLVNVDLGGCDSAEICNTPAAHLTATGQLASISSNSQAGGVILKMTCR